MTDYWLIKLLLLAGLAVLAWLVMRPIRSQSHLALRRLAILALLAFAVFAIVFPGLLNRIAFHLGVERGLNLLVYALVIAVFGQLTTAYRREAAQERKLTALSRAIALAEARIPGPSDPGRSSGSGRSDEPSDVGPRGASRPGDVETPR